MCAKKKSPKEALKLAAQPTASSVKYMWQRGDFARKAKEIFMVNAKDVTYEPLRGPAHIRLLTLEPGSSPGSILRCSMRHVDLNDRPEYTALSYTWKLDHTIFSLSYAVAKSYASGEQRVKIPQDTDELKFSKEIVCNGKVTKISTNLYNALVHLRRKRTGDYWIDALCINQLDDEEKTTQVQFMGQIYKCASEVVVWLGATSMDVADPVAYLEHLTTNAVDMAPLSISDLKNDGDAMNSEQLIHFRVTWVALSIVMSQWFRRTWVVQELCWANNVVFVVGNAQMSIQCVAKAFKLAKRTIAAIAKDPEIRNTRWVTETNILDEIGRVWAPQLQHAPMTLEARETFQQGNRWTLRQWLMACRGRLATDSRDLVFAGLSLITPDLLIIDQSLQCGEPAPLRDSSDIHFLLRKYYPQVIPPTGLKQSDRPGRRGGTSVIVQASPVLPKGLWPKLNAEYKEVGIAEVLINTAACLLTHTGTEEILSIAARTRCPEKLESQWIVPGDPLDKEDLLTKETLPSWVPAPWAWTAHVSEIEAFRPQSRPLSGVTATDRPRISNDGSALFLGASRVDVVDHFYLDFTIGSVWDAGESTSPLDTMLATLVKYRRQVVLTTLSQLLFDPDTEQSPYISGDQNMWILHNLSYSACAKIAESRTKQLHMRPRRFDYPKKTSDAFARWFGRSQKKEGARADEILSLFAKVQATYPDENWPTWADPLRFDMEVHKAFLRQLAGSSNTGSGSNPANEGQGGSTRDANRPQSRKSVRVFEKNQTPASRARATEEARDSQEKTLLSKLKPRDADQYARLTALVHSRLTWRKVFITRHGFLGLGPSWLNRGDTIMFIRGTRVPYAFSPLRTDIRRREKDIRKAIDDNQNKYNKIVKTLQTKEKKNAYLHPIEHAKYSHQQRRLKGLDEEHKNLGYKLDRISTTRLCLNAWVLQGEVSVESTLEQQAMKSEAWERITIT